MAKQRISGIYKITSPSGKIYIGQSIHILKRKERYQYYNCKKQSKVYSSLLKYRWENHVFEIIHKCPKEELNHWEKFYIDLYKSTAKNTGLNLREGGSETWKMSDETKEKLRKINTGRKQSPETLLKISLAGKGRKLSPEQIIKIKAANLGRKHSDEFKKKCSENAKSGKNGMLGKKHSSETIAKMKLRRPTVETKEKIRNTLKGRKMPLHVKEALLKACIGRIPWNKGKILPEETRAKIRQARAKQGPMSLEGRKKVSEHSKRNAKKFWERVQQEKLTMIF